MTPSDLHIAINCTRQLLGSSLAAQTKPQEMIKAWEAVEACERHHAEMLKERESPVANADSEKSP